MPQVRLALDALPDETRTLRLRDRALVEPVAGELDAVEAELAEEITLREPRGVVCKPAAAKLGMDGKALELDDPVRPARVAVAEGARARTVHVDQHPAVRLGLLLRALDLGLDRLPIARSPTGEEGLDVIRRVELDQPVDVGRRGPAKRDHDGSEGALANDGSGTVGAGRRARRESPVPSATPPRMRTSPPTAAPPTLSPRKIAPYASATGGTR